MRRRLGAIALACALLSAGPAGADDLPTPAAMVAAFADRIVPNSGGGVVIATLDHGTVTYAASPKLMPTTVFEIGSVTKTFTALLLADMVVRHEVSLDDPIEKYLPAGVTAPTLHGKHITLLDLATQSSGLPRLPTNLDLAAADPTNPYRDYTVDKLYAFLSKYTLTRDIGASYEYSNLGVGLLGVLLANRAGVSYEALLHDRITGPLGMAHTSIALSPEQQAALAPGHDADGEIVRPWDFASLVAAGGIRSTPEDMVRYLKLLAGDGPPELVAAMKLATTAQPGKSGEPNQGIGLVWQIGKKAGTVWHNGQTGGTHSMIAITADRTRGVVVLANSVDGVEDLGFHLLVPTFPLAPAKHEIALDAKTLDGYAGTYTLAPGVVFTLVRKDDFLYAQLTGQASYRVHPSARDEFFYRIVDAQLSFSRDAAGKVSGLTLHQGGQNLFAPKVVAAK